MGVGVDVGVCVCVGVCGGIVQPADNCCRSNDGDVVDDDDDPNMFHSHNPGELLCFLLCFSFRNFWFSSM